MTDLRAAAQIRSALKGARGLALDHDEPELDAEFERAIEALDALAAAPDPEAPVNSGAGTTVDGSPDPDALREDLFDAINFQLAGRMEEATPVAEAITDDVLEVMAAHGVTLTALRPTGSPDPEALREALAALEHEQWMAWSRSIADSEKLSGDRLARWRVLWVPFDWLTPEQQASDYEWADKVLALARPTESPEPLDMHPDAVYAREGKWRGPTESPEPRGAAGFPVEPWEEDDCGCVIGKEHTCESPEPRGEGRPDLDVERARATLTAIRAKVEAASYHRNYRQACIDIADALTPQPWWDDAEALPDCGQAGCVKPRGHAGWLDGSGCWSPERAALSDTSTPEARGVCPKCGGDGEVLGSDFDGPPVTICRACGGTGKSPEHPLAALSDTSTPEAE